MPVRIYNHVHCRDYIYKFSQSGWKGIFSLDVEIHLSGSEYHAISASGFLPVPERVIRIIRKLCNDQIALIDASAAVQAFYGPHLSLLTFVNAVCLPNVTTKMQINRFQVTPRHQFVGKENPL